MEWIDRITATIDYIESHLNAADYEIEVYPPGDTSSDDYICEIWIPITK